MQLSWPCSQFWWCSTKRLELVICGVSWDLGRFISWGWAQLCCFGFKAASGNVQLYWQGTFSKLVKHARLEPGWCRLNELLSESWTLSLLCPKIFPKDLCSVFNPVGYYADLLCQFFNCTSVLQQKNSISLWIKFNVQYQWPALCFATFGTFFKCRFHMEPSPKAPADRFFSPTAPT